MTTVSDATWRPRLGVFKFASCDGCQLSLLSCEDELLTLAEKLEIAYFLEASSHVGEGPFDIALVEGSITTPSDRERIRRIRSESKFLMTIGACATAGGIQALRNWGNHQEWMRMVYAQPDYIKTLSKSTAIADHVAVDFELRGCPINKEQLLEVIRALLQHRKPRTPQSSVCIECKRRGTVCVAVARGIPCIGPITQAGCGAICPHYHRGCYGCFGPCTQANSQSLVDWYREAGVPRDELIGLVRSYNANAREFRDVGHRLESPS